jgi:hypothetical protein
MNILYLNHLSKAIKSHVKRNYGKVERFFLENLIRSMEDLYRAYPDININNCFVVLQWSRQKRWILFEITEYIRQDTRTTIEKSNGVMIMFELKIVTRKNVIDEILNEK